MKIYTIERKGKVLAIEDEMNVAGKLLSFKKDGCSLLALQGAGMERNVIDVLNDILKANYYRETPIVQDFGGFGYVDVVDYTGAVLKDSLAEVADKQGNSFHVVVKEYNGYQVGQLFE